MGMRSLSCIGSTLRGSYCIVVQMKPHGSNLSRPLLAADRITKPYAIEDSWCDKRGFFQYLVNKETGQKWDIGRDYEYEGYVNDLNCDIENGKFK